MGGEDRREGGRGGGSEWHGYPPFLPGKGTQTGGSVLLKKVRKRRKWRGEEMLEGGERVAGRRGEEGRELLEGGERVAGRRGESC